MEMIEKRISDRSVLQLIRKWIQVGVIDEGKFLVSETGTGQGQTISPLLANIYLHYVLDEWFEEVVKPRLRSEAHEIRFADGTPVQTSNSRGASPLILQTRPPARSPNGRLGSTLISIFSEGRPAPMSQ